MGVCLRRPLTYPEGKVQKLLHHRRATRSGSLPQKKQRASGLLHHPTPLFPSLTASTTTSNKQKVYLLHTASQAGRLLAAATGCSQTISLSSTSAPSTHPRSLKRPSLLPILRTVLHSAGCYIGPSFLTRTRSVPWTRSLPQLDWASTSDAAPVAYHHIIILLLRPVTILSLLHGLLPSSQLAGTLSSESLL